MIDLIGKRYYFFGLSILFILFGIFMYFQNGGFNYDIQFAGGTVMQFQMKNGNFDPAAAEKLLKENFNKTLTAIKSETVLASIRNEEKKLTFLVVNVASDGAMNLEEQNKVKELINANFNVEPGTQPQTTLVDPSIGREMKQNSLMAVIISSILIILYIWWRFNIMSGLSAGLTAIAGLLHDVAVMVSVYTIFNIPLNESFIAAVLTIMGYSMNDTVIIYDRIRENSNLLKRVPVLELVNRSVIQTLSRSINTVVTVLICVTTVYVFASIKNIPSIKQFALPLIIGVASGCYSSIFVASPLYGMWKKRSQKRLAASK